jgi:phospholipase C
MLKTAAICAILVLFVSTARAEHFSHIVVVVQENRTPDNLFQGLCTAPYGSADSCSIHPTAAQYDIETDNWLNKKSSTGVTQPQPVTLVGTYDPGHTHQDFVAMCDAGSGKVCRMDGADEEDCSPSCPIDPEFGYVENSSDILNPYLELVTQYGWANYMFQTNQGSSFPAHQYLFGATSAPTAADDAAGIFAAVDPNGSDPSDVTGCVSAADVTVPLIDPTGKDEAIYPCFEHQTIADMLPSDLTWRYYASGNGVWTAPNAIQHICESSGPGGQCTGTLWSSHLDIISPADVLKDIADCNLRSLSWVTPAWQNSDHSFDNDGGGPSWVASIVNAIGTSTACDNKTGYWKNTAILITWDDWGGWYDHEPPTILTSVQGDYERGFRVPLIVVSAYTPVRFIDSQRLDFGAVARFIEQNFDVAPGALGFADSRTSLSLNEFFSLSDPRSYVTIAAPKGAKFFLEDKRPPRPIDND